MSSPPRTEKEKKGTNTTAEKNALIKSIINSDDGAEILIKTQWSKAATGCRLGAVLFPGALPTLSF